VATDTPAPGPGVEAFRVDIQALRGAAVLFVLVYHSGLGLARSGYLGVDMFFVVSGFLISRIVARDVDAGRFRYRAFYFRRARRILPAAFATLLLTVIAAPWLLTTSQFVEFRDQVIGSVLFVANMVLWDQTGYFSREAWQQPLLHMWSLAIEEQFYLLLPVALVLLRGRGRVRFALIALATLLSFGLCMLLVLRNPAATFYFLPTRAWELGIGSLGALASGHAATRKVAGILLWPAVAVALLVPILSSDLPHPGVAAAAVCLATLVIMLARSEVLNSSALIRPLARVGDFSYSLYLVHWPLFAFARVLYMERELPIALALALMAASLALGYLMYRFVETPLRTTPPERGRPLIAWLGMAAIMLIVLPIALVAHRAAPDRRALAQVEGFDGCLKQDAPAIDRKCAQSGAPAILVWGDSYGGHIIPGLDATTDRPIEQQTRAMCGPIADFTERVGLAERTKARRCLQWNASVLHYLQDRPSVDVVMLVSRWDRFLNPAAGIVTAAGPIALAPEQRAAAVRDAILSTAERLRRLGKRVVVIASPPTARIDQGLCWERKTQHLPTFGPFARCRLGPEMRAPLEAATNAMLADVEREGVPVIFLDRGMCRGGQCVNEMDGQSLYRDAGHLTKLGSIVAARTNDLGNEVWRRAR
jgi:peptidoglycan/LPS O-acetylase OafA/YrhL